MDKGTIIDLLNKDIEDEHGAIIQYLSHAYAMGEGEMACEIEALAREEMRHLDWLAETVVELGGVPSLKRGAMNMAGTSVSEWMGNNVGLEEGAIAQYKEQIEELAREQADAAASVNEKWERIAADVTEIAINPYKKDIAVTMFGVVWVPYHLVQSGKRTLELPAFGQEDE